MTKWIALMLTVVLCATGAAVLLSGGDEDGTPSVIDQLELPAPARADADADRLYLSARGGPVLALHGRALAVADQGVEHCAAAIADLDEMIEPRRAAGLTGAVGDEVLQVAFEAEQSEFGQALSSCRGALEQPPQQLRQAIELVERRLAEMQIVSGNGPER